MYRSTAVLHLHELQLENMPTNVFHRNLASYSLCQRTVRGNHFLQMKTVKQALILNKLWLSSTQHEWPAVTIQISQAGSLLNQLFTHSLAEHVSEECAGNRNKAFCSIQTETPLLVYSYILLPPPPFSTHISLLFPPQPSLSTLNTNPSCLRMDGGGSW